jgi:ECF sigma factor
MLSSKDREVSGPSPGPVSERLTQWAAGDEEALRALVPLIYGELRRQARRYLRKERADHTLQTTALVHEAYLRLRKQGPIQFQNREHFFAIAAQLMRQILVVTPGNRVPPSVVWRGHAEWSGPGQFHQSIARRRVRTRCHPRRRPAQTAAGSDDSICGQFWIHSHGARHFNGGGSTAAARVGGHWRAVQLDRAHPASVARTV